MEKYRRKKDSLYNVVISRHTKSLGTNCLTLKILERISSQAFVSHWSFSGKKCFVDKKMRPRNPSV